MTAFCTIIILEYWFEMNASSCNSFLVFVNNLSDIVFVPVFALQILATGEKSVVLIDRSNSYYRCLFNSSLCESFVYASAKGDIVEELFRITCLVFCCKRVVFFVC